MSARDIIAVACGMALCWLAERLDDNFRMTQIEWDMLMVRIGARRR